MSPFNTIQEEDQSQHEFSNYSLILYTPKLIKKRKSTHSSTCLYPAQEKFLVLAEVVPSGEDGSITASVLSELGKDGRSVANAGLVGGLSG